MLLPIKPIRFERPDAETQKAADQRQLFYIWINTVPKGRGGSHEEDRHQDQNADHRQGGPLHKGGEAVIDFDVGLGLIVVVALQGCLHCVFGIFQMYIHEVEAVQGED